MVREIGQVIEKVTGPLPAVPDRAPEPEHGEGPETDHSHAPESETDALIDVTVDKKLTSYPIFQASCVVVEGQAIRFQ